MFVASTPNWQDIKSDADLHKKLEDRRARIRQALLAEIVMVGGQAGFSFTDPEYAEALKGTAQALTRRPPTRPATAGDHGPLAGANLPNR
jgi:hypothetical protein